MKEKNDEKLHDALSHWMPLMGIRTIIIEFTNADEKSPLRWIKGMDITALVDECKLEMRHSFGPWLASYFNPCNARKREGWMDEKATLVSKDNYWCEYMLENETKLYLVLNLDTQV